MRYIVAKGAAGAGLAAGLLLTVAACSGEGGRPAEAAPEQTVVVELGESDVAVVQRAEYAIRRAHRFVMPYRVVPLRA